MSYLIEQLPDKRWGIYYKTKLLASIDCHTTSFEILRRLHAREFKTLAQKISSAKSPTVRELLPNQPTLAL